MRKLHEIKENQRNGQEGGQDIKRYTPFLNEGYWQIGDRQIDQLRNFGNPNNFQEQDLQRLLEGRHRCIMA